MLCAGTLPGPFRARVPVLLHPVEGTRSVHVPAVESLKLRGTPDGWLRCCFCVRLFRVVDESGTPTTHAPLTCSRHCALRSLNRPTTEERVREPYEARKRSRNKLVAPQRSEIPPCP